MGTTMEPTSDEIEAATQELLAEGVAYDVKFLDRDDAMVQSCKLGELALERARRRVVERELGQIRHALQDQARQVGDMINTAVSNATTLQQIEIAGLVDRVNELEQELARPDLSPNVPVISAWDADEAMSDVEASPKDLFQCEKRFETRIKDVDDVEQ